MLSILWRRKRERDTVAGGNEALDISYNRAIGGLKVMPVLGQLTPLGDILTAKALPYQGTLVAFYNDSAVTLYVAFGDSTVALPTSTTGIAIPPKHYITLASGLGTHVRSSAACLAYVVDDDTFLGPQNGQY